MLNYWKDMSSHSCILLCLLFSSRFNNRTECFIHFYALALSIRMYVMCVNVYKMVLIHLDIMTGENITTPSLYRTLYLRVPQKYYRREFIIINVGVTDNLTKFKQEI